MCHKERSARCLTSNLQHKKSLRMKFSTARKTFDKRLRYYERQYNKNIIPIIETVSSSNPREFWQKIKTHCQCNKKQNKNKTKQQSLGCFCLFHQSCFNCLSHNFLPVQAFET